MATTLSSTRSRHGARPVRSRNRSRYPSCTRGASVRDKRECTEEPRTTNTAPAKTRGRSRRPSTSGGTAAAAIALGLICATSAVHSSSHREAPFITKSPQVDGTDFYAFRSYEPGRGDYVTFLANYQPAQVAYGGPNYFPLDANALYEIHVDNDGDAIEDITLRFDFSNDTPSGGIVEFPIGEGGARRSVPSVLRNVAPVDADAAPGLGLAESYRVDIVFGDRRHGRRERLRRVADGGRRFAKPFDYVGTKTYGDGGYEAYAERFVHDVAVPGCEAHGRVFVGQRLDGFAIALGEVFDLVNFVPIDGDSTPGASDGGGFPGGVTQDPARNALARNNVTTLAIELPISCLTGEGNGVIGAWTTASRRQVTVLNPHPTLARPELTGGRWTQVSRLGNFLVNELFIGLPDKDRFNASEPKDDARFAGYVTHPAFPAIIDALFRDAVNTTLGSDLASLAPRNVPRQDLVAGFLTGFPGVNQLARVTPSEMLRLNTTIEATPRDAQRPLGLAAGDLAGFPNGRRPGDDAVDIALRVALGALCHPLPLGDGGAPVALGLCDPTDAPVGTVALTDGVPLSARDFDAAFPYLLTPYPGSPIGAALPRPRG